MSDDVTEVFKIDLLCTGEFGENSIHVVRNLLLLSKLVFVIKVPALFGGIHPFICGKNLKHRFLLKSTASHRSMPLMTCSLGRHLVSEIDDRSLDPYVGWFTTSAALI